MVGSGAVAERHTIEGLVLRTEAGFCRVLTDDGSSILLNIAKKMKAGQRTSTTPVVIGDRVSIRAEPDGVSGAVEKVLTRRNELIRLAPGRKVQKDVLAANLDNLIIVQALHRPDFTYARLDRFLAIAEQAEIPATVVLNKVDLATETEADEIAAVYRQIGYRVIISSAKALIGIEDIHHCLVGITAIIGPSGVGKSTLLNRIFPDLHLRTGEVNEMTGKGKHTTVVSELLPLDGGAWVADTPGLRAVSMAEIDRYEVAWLFKEMQPMVATCRFADCLHRDEPGCTVLSAVQAGEIAPVRYASYCRLLEDVAAGMIPDWESGIETERGY